MDVTKPYKFIRFGAMAITKPYEFIGCGATDVTKHYEFIGFGAMVATKPYEFAVTIRRKTDSQASCKCVGCWGAPATG